VANWGTESGDSVAAVTEHPLWHCPKCGARLVSRKPLRRPVPAQRSLYRQFRLHRWLENPRIVKTVDYGPRWRGHFVRITSAVDLDGELRAWLQESHDVVGMQSDLTERRVGQAKTRRRR